MKEFTETFFIAVIGTIISLISFLVPLTYSYLRETAVQLGKWRADSYDLKDNKIFHFNQISHYYSFADTIIDIIAVSGAFCILSIVFVMSQSLIPKINPYSYMPFRDFLVCKYSLLLLFFIYYFIIWLIVSWNFLRYWEFEKIKFKGKLDSPPIIFILILLLYILMIIFFWGIFKINSELIKWVYLLTGGCSLISIHIFKPRERKLKGKNKDYIKKRFHFYSLLIFVLGLMLITVFASLHLIFLLRSHEIFIGYGVILIDITLLVSLFLFWLLLGFLFTPNTSIIYLYSLSGK